MLGTESHESYANSSFALRMKLVVAEVYRIVNMSFGRDITVTSG